MAAYTDILHCSRPLTRHVKMTVSHRAKQFAPFAALKGFEDSVHKKEIIYDSYRELSDEKAEELDHKLRLLRCKDLITVTFFIREAGLPALSGHYRTVTGRVEFIDQQKRRMRIKDTEIPFQWITELKFSP